jgi:hypothetical protein
MEVTGNGGWRRRILEPGLNQVRHAQEVS